MKKNKIFTWRINLFLFIIFSIGCIFGISIHNFSISKFESYLLVNSNNDDTVDIYGENPDTGTTDPDDSDNTDSGNTDSDNTDSDNTDSGNTDSDNTGSGNTGSGNTGSGNTDSSNTDSGSTTKPSTSSPSTITKADSIGISKFILKNNSIKPGEKAYIDFSTYGNTLKGATFVFYSSELQLGFSSQLDYENDSKKYFEVPKDTVAGTYKLTQISLVANSNKGGIFTKYYGSSSSNKLAFDISLTVQRDEIKKEIELQNLIFEKNEATLDEDLLFNISTNTEIDAARFTFKNAKNNKTVFAYMKKENGKTSLRFPSSTEEGTYVLENLVLSNSDTSTVYTKTGENDSKKYDFYISIAVKKAILTELEYNNEDITSEIISEISSSTAIKKLTINADAKPIISSDIFKAIKGKDIILTINYKGNQYIFNGKQIESAKDMDVSIKIYSLSSTTKDNDIKALYKDDGIILAFSLNGNLPGKMTIKIKQTEDMEKILGTDKVFVYYFNSDTSKFEKVSSNVSLDENNYYEFSLTPNSRFLLTVNELDESLLKQNEESYFIDSNLCLIVMIVSIILIIVIIVLLVLSNKKEDENYLIVDNKKDEKTEKNKFENNDNKKIDSNIEEDIKINENEKVDTSEVKPKDDIKESTKEVNKQRNAAKKNNRKNK